MSNNVSLSFVGLEKVEQSESIICQSRRQREIIDIGRFYARDVKVV